MDNCINRHAYLIIAHSNFQSLKYLIQAIDDERNDIYLHIDKKSKNAPIKEIQDWPVKSHLFMVPRRNISWGHLSIVKCELALLKRATRHEYYSYYHLLSGVDFPLKTQDEIHEFLKDKDEEYISFYHEGDDGRTFMEKLRFFYPFMKWNGKDAPTGRSIKDRMVRKIRILNTSFFEWQVSKGIDRTRKFKNLEIVKGDQWFTITDNFARYLCKSKRKLLRLGFMTDGFDEFFVGIAAFNSRFKEKVNGSCLRKIDWNRGRPYEFRNEDISELLEAKEFFARKIVYENEPELVRALASKIGVNI